MKTKACRELQSSFVTSLRKVQEGPTENISQRTDFLAAEQQQMVIQFRGWDRAV